MATQTKEQFLDSLKKECADPKQGAVLYVMRGLPGSGKSTLAKEIARTYQNLQETRWGANICSADNFWVQKDGNYKFDPKKLKEAHQACLRQFIRNVSLASPLILDNTNIKINEFAGYVAIGEAFGYKTVIVTLSVSPDVAKQRNIHSVPSSTIAKMNKNFEEFNSKECKQVFIDMN